MIITSTPFFEKAAMENGTFSITWVLGMMVVAGAIALIIAIMTGRGAIEGEVLERRLRKYRNTIKENYEVSDKAGGLCGRCSHHGRVANLKIYENRMTRSLMIFECPSCGTLFQVNLESKGGPLLSVKRSEFP
jgi:hypothetical protein